MSKPADHAQDTLTERRVLHSQGEDSGVNTRTQSIRVSARNLARICAGLGVLLTFIATDSQAQGRDSTVQFSLDRTATLVQKDFGPERWSVTHRISDGYTMGNVFFTDGRPAAFLSCEDLGGDLQNIELRCHIAQACTESPCSALDYSLIEGTASLPRAFFFPPDEVVGPSNLDALVGSWRVEVRRVSNPNDPNPAVWEFDLSTVVGNELRGFNQFGDVVVVKTISDNNAEHRFRLIHSLIGVCGVFEFNLIGENKIEGITYGSLKTTSLNCTLTPAPGVTGEVKIIAGVPR